MFFKHALEYMRKKRSEQMEGHSVSGESRKNGWVEQKKELTKVLKIAWPAVFESFLSRWRA